MLLSLEGESRRITIGSGVNRLDFSWNNFSWEKQRVRMLPSLDDVKGRRNRVIRSLVNHYPTPESVTGFMLYVNSQPLIPVDNREYSMGEIVELLKAHQLPGLFALRTSPAIVDTNRVYKDIESFDPESKREAELHEALQDLGNEIVVDIVEACAVLNDPDVWYPGVDEGIEPVTDDHVRLVMTALQRELNRETRIPKMTNRVDPTTKLPAVPLASLPWRIQRALAERRRLRYTQYGIGFKQWEENTWDVWAIQEDPDWEPRKKRWDT